VLRSISFSVDEIYKFSLNKIPSLLRSKDKMADDLQQYDHCGAYNTSSRIWPRTRPYHYFTA